MSGPPRAVAAAASRGLPPHNSGMSPQGTRAESWLARLSFVLAFSAVAVVLAIAELKGIAVFAAGVAAAAVSLAAGFVVLSRGVGGMPGPRRRDGARGTGRGQGGLADA